MINYPVELDEVVNGDKRPSKTCYWAAHLFAMKPSRPGKWSYDAGYQDCYAHYEFEYDPKKEAFAGHEVVIAHE